MRVHDLPHTCATNLLRVGVLEGISDEILGHGSTATGRLYAHVVRPSPVEAIDRLPWLPTGGVSASGGKSAEQTQEEAENLDISNATLG